MVHSAIHPLAKVFRPTHSQDLTAKKTVIALTAVVWLLLSVWPLGHSSVTVQFVATGSKLPSEETAAQARRPRRSGVSVIPCSKHVSYYFCKLRGTKETFRTNKHLLSESKQLLLPSQNRTKSERERERQPHTTN